MRKEPLLNTKAAAAAIAPLAFNSPAKPDSGGKLKAFEDLKGPLFPEPVTNISELGMDDWNLPEDHFDPNGSHASPGGPRRDKPKRSHRGGSAVRKSPAPESSAKPDITGTPTPAHTLTSKPAPVSFDWGPLPTFASPTPLKTLPIKFMPVSPPVQSATVSGGTNVPDSKALEAQKNLPKGFVAFSTFSPKTAATSSPLIAPSSDVQKGFSFAPTSANPSQGFSFSNFSSQQR